MATDRTANVVWQGDLLNGSGTIAQVPSGAFGPLDVSWASRAEEPNGKTSPEELTPENAQRHSLIHPRCGTAFLLWVMVVSVFVYALLGRPVWYWLIISRIVLLPVIAGIAYELIRFAGKHSDNRILMTLLAPGLWLQRLTTREPTLDQLEVSIKALKEVLDLEGREQPADRRVEVMA